MGYTEIEPPKAEKTFSVTSTIEVIVTESNDLIIDNLLANSKAAIMGAVELHNKPIFPYRYEISIILTINAWELALKAYLLTHRKDVRVFEEGWSKEFLNCVNSVYEHVGKDFMLIKESIDLLYKYRCDVIHFYGKDVDVILYSLLRPNILFFSDFLFKYFDTDLAKQANLIILPIGFKKSASALEFISKSITQGKGPISDFANSILNSARKLSENGIEDGLLCNHEVYLENVNKIKHADFVVAITSDPEKAQLMLKKTVTLATFTDDESAPKYRIEEDSLFKTKFTMATKEFIQKLKTEIPGFKETGQNKKVIGLNIKSDANCYKIRYLDITNPKSGKKGFYSTSAITKAKELFLS